MTVDDVHVNEDEVDVSASVYFRYERARASLLADQGFDPSTGTLDALGSRVEAAAQEFGLSNGLTDLLLVTTLYFDHNPEQLSFRQGTGRIHNTRAHEAAVRGLAAEHRSLVEHDLMRDAWVAKALRVVDGQDLDATDALLLYWKVEFGKWQEGVSEINSEMVAEGLRFLIGFGSFDAPALVLWWIDRIDHGTDSGRQEVADWLQRVVARDDVALPHAMRADLIDQLRERLAQMTE